MKIKFDTGEITQDEAKGLIALLGQLAGIGDMSPTVRVGVQLERKIAKAAELAMGYGEGQPAPDGYPVDPEDAPGGTGYPPRLVEVERDVAGTPWDERIHASTKTTNKDGTWTRRRNTPDATFDAVMAELKARNTAMTAEAAAGLAGNVAAGAPSTHAVPVAPTTSTPAVPSEPTAAEAFTPPPSVVIAPTVPQPPVAPTPPVPAPVADDAAAEPVAIMRVLSDKRVAGDTLAVVLAKAGLPGLAGVFTAPIEARRIIAAELAVL